MSLKAKQNFLAVVGLLLIVVLCYGAFVAIRSTVAVLSLMKSDLAVAIIAAGATVFVSVLSIVLGKVYEAREQIAREHREKKIPVYEDLLKFMFRILMGTKAGNPPSEAEIIEFMTGFTQRVMVWGSDDVLAVWVKWRRLSVSPDAQKQDPFKLLVVYEELIRAIRRDLGHKNKGLARGDILALFVNDIDKHLPPAGRP